LKANTSELNKIHPINQPNKTWKWWKVCISRQTVPNIDYKFSEEWTPSSATRMFNLVTFVDDYYSATLCRLFGTVYLQKLSLANI